MGQAASQACPSGSEESYHTAKTSIESDDDSSCGSSSDEDRASDLLNSSDSSRSSMIDVEESNETMENEEDYQSSDDEDPAPKSSKVIITDFVASDCIMKTDISCGPFTKTRATTQKRVQKWDCGCELITALRSIEGSREPDGIGLAIIKSHGKMEGDEQYLCLSKRSKCKRCISPIPLWRVMAALNSTKINIGCALLACRTQEGLESGDDSSVDPSSLATRFVSLLQPCGAGNTHNTHSIAIPTLPTLSIDETRQLMLKTLYECKAVREAMDSLRGHFIYGIVGKKMNETPIEVHMHKDWMRHEETNEDGLAPLQRPILDELSPHEKLQALFAIYKDDPSHEKRVRALEKLRSLVAVFWDEIFTMHDLKEPFLKDILKALAIETDNKLMERLIQVTVEAAMNSIDRTTGFQTWNEIGRFIENCLNSDNVSLKMRILSILEKVPNLFGNDIGSPLSIMKTTLNETNRGVQSAAIKWLLGYLSVDETGDLSPLIPIILQRAEERLIDAEKDNESSLIGSIEELVYRYHKSFPVGSLISVVKKGLQSHASERLKERMLSSLVILRVRETIRNDPKSLSNIVVILRCCSASASAKLKKHAFRIIRKTPEALTSDPIAAAHFFKTLLEDSNEKIRKCATFFYSETFRNNNDDRNMLSALSPLIPTVIKLAYKCNRAIADLSNLENFSIMLPYLDDLINLSTTVMRTTEVIGKRSSNRLFYALSILTNLFSAHWSRCWLILGVNGISSLLKLISEKASWLTEENANEKLESKIDDARQQLADLIVVLTQKDETRAEALRFIEECGESTNDSLKKFALRTVWNDDVEFPEAPSLFKKLLSDSSVRTFAAEVFVAYTKREQTNGHSVDALLNLLPLLIKAIDGEEMGFGFTRDMQELVKTTEEIPATEHIRAVVECTIRVEIGSDEVWEKTKRQLYENTSNMKMSLSTLKGPNVLQTAMDVAHSFMQKENWKERCMGLHGFVAVAKEGHKSMKEHMEKITPLLKDPNSRVRSLAWLALGEIASHSWSKFTEHDMVILPLISALNDEDHNVGAHVFYVLAHDCPKEILLSHLTPLIDGIIEYTQKEMNRIGKGKKRMIGVYLRSEDSHLEHILPVVYKLTASAQASAPFYDKIMNLLKSFLVYRLEKHHINVEYVIECVKCISHVGGMVDKETFFTDAKEVLHLLAAKADILEWEIFDEIARFCTILGSDFAPLLPLVMNGILNVATSAPQQTPCPCGRRGCGDDEICVPKGRPHADAAIVLFAQTLGKSFSPYIDKVFKVAVIRLKDASFDFNCWSGEIFTHLLACLDGIEAKKMLFNKFWPDLKLAIEEINSNQFSAKAMNSVTRSLEHLGSEGISNVEIAELCKLISSELDAIKKRSVEGKERQETNDEDSESDSDDDEDLEYRRQRDLKFEKDALNAIRETVKVGESILGPSFTIDVVKLAELMDDDGVVKPKENSDNSDAEKGTAIK